MVLCLLCAGTEDTQITQTAPAASVSATASLSLSLHAQSASIFPVVSLQSHRHVAQSCPFVFCLLCSRSVEEEVNQELICFLFFLGVCPPLPSSLSLSLTAIYLVTRRACWPTRLSSACHWKRAQQLLRNQGAEVNSKAPQTWGTQDAG